MLNYDLWENVRHELVSISGLKAFDNLGESVTSDDSHVSVSISEVIPLDFNDLIKKIDKILNDTDTSIEDYVLDNCIEWYNLISELSEKEEELYIKKEEYNRKEFEIMFIEDIDFKTLYGSTAEKVRKQHAKTKLKDLSKEVKSLELSIEYCKRRLNYLKGLVTVKTALLEEKSHE